MDGVLRRPPSTSKAAAFDIVREAEGYDTSEAEPAPGAKRHRDRYHSAISLDITSPPMNLTQRVKISADFIFNLGTSLSSPSITRLSAAVFSLFSECVNAYAFLITCCNADN